VSQSNRISALLAYLLLIIGWFYVFLLNRDDKLAVYHAKQSIMIVLAAIGAPIVWAVFSWIITFIPLVGGVLAAASFALVIATYFVLVVAWFVGMSYALQAKQKPVPLVGRWAEHLPFA
jgi:uncharacterized membrane protein